MIEPDLRTRLGRTGVWGHLDTLSASDLRAYARRVEELGDLFEPTLRGGQSLPALRALAAK